MDDAFDAGAAAGRDIARQAIDCPFPPTDATGQRARWLAGFSSIRGEASPSSDPAHTAGLREPDGPTRVSGTSMHEG